MFTNDTIGEEELLFIVLSGTKTAFLLSKRVSAVVSSKFFFWSECNSGKKQMEKH